MQNDYLYETLSPRECLMFAANLKLKVSPEEKEKIVNKLLRNL